MDLLKSAEIFYGEVGVHRHFPVIGLWRESAKVVSRAKRGISTYQALSAEIIPRFARQDTSLALSRQRLIRDECGYLDEDYDRHNPEGTVYGRRNFNETSYFSGNPELEPGEYRSEGFDFYREYGENRDVDFSRKGYCDFFGGVA
jgi:hypothetical protein